MSWAVLNTFKWLSEKSVTLQWRHNERNGVSNHWRLDCLLDRLIRRRSNSIVWSTALHYWFFVKGNPPLTIDNIYQNLCRLMASLGHHMVSSDLSPHKSILNSWLKSEIWLQSSTALQLLKHLHVYVLYVISNALCTRLCCGLLSWLSTLYPMRYVHCCVVVCFVYEACYIPCVMYTVVLWFVLLMKHVISHALCTLLCCGLFC